MKYYGQIKIAFEFDDQAPIGTSTTTNSWQEHYTGPEARQRIDANNAAFDAEFKEIMRGASSTPNPIINKPQPNGNSWGNAAMGAGLGIAGAGLGGMAGYYLGGKTTADPQKQKNRQLIGGIIGTGIGGLGTGMLANYLNK